MNPSTILVYTPVMTIKVIGASENNLREIDALFSDGLTVVTGVSGSGKSSLVFDTLHREASNRFSEAFSSVASPREPVKVKGIDGLGPVVSLDQNILNRNPNSTLATASGLHPLFRLLYARFGKRYCSSCSALISIITEDDLIARIITLSKTDDVGLIVPLVRGAKGSHKTLLALLKNSFPPESILVDGRAWPGRRLKSEKPHDIFIKNWLVGQGEPAGKVSETVREALSLGVPILDIETGKQNQRYSTASVCPECSTSFGELEPGIFHRPCPACKGKGCEDCRETGLHPEALSVTWQDQTLPELLSESISDVCAEFASEAGSPGMERLLREIGKRAEALDKAGLGYITLDRPAPSLSRGEAQRLRLAVALTSSLEDIIHILDEPTIGQHPEDVQRIIPHFQKLPGPVIFVEHDRTAAAMADFSVDLGPGAGEEGGLVLHNGPYAKLLKKNTHTGRFFSGREKVFIKKEGFQPDGAITISGAKSRNLKNIDLEIPVNGFIVLTGVSGSGKSTLVEEVLIPSLKSGRPEGCRTIKGPPLKPVLVDQKPIGKNPRSNPGTYTRLSDRIRDLFADRTGKSASLFSFNTKDGSCRECSGMGAKEVKMRFLPSVWVRCDSCGGARFNDEALEQFIKIGSGPVNIAEIHAMPLGEIRELFERIPDWRGTSAAMTILDALIDTGLGYLRLGQPSPTLSGGEAQRIKLARNLSRQRLKDTLILLDEPSTGLHPRDITSLLNVFQRLISAGATVLVIEHNTDIIRWADWVIDLGPGSGPEGGELVFQGPVSDLAACRKSATARALLLEREESAKVPDRVKADSKKARTKAIRIVNARANNLKGVTLDIPKGVFTVVSGVSGSGKSSLVRDVLEREARRRYLESLSMYERQGTSEGPEAEVDSIRGLGVACSISPGSKLMNPRSTVGTITEIIHHLASVMSAEGAQHCPDCGREMSKQKEWTCSRCEIVFSPAEPRHFLPGNYAAACPKCHGVGTVQRPNPSKLIIHPDKPLIAGAMYSPGFFPAGYLGKPFNHGYDIVQALGNKYEFSPETTLWNEMPDEARQAFLYGDPEPLTVERHSRKRGTRIEQTVFGGFYGSWLRDWDVGGTFTDTVECAECGGSGLRPRFASIYLKGKNHLELTTITLDELLVHLTPLTGKVSPVCEESLTVLIRRLDFLVKVGLGYLNLRRPTGTLSAGEAQRIRLAGLLGSRLTNMTVILDEPTRGMHPSEVNALLACLKELSSSGNTVLVVEHDPSVIASAEHLVELGPGGGRAGGRIVAQGGPKEVLRINTATSRWMSGARKMNIPEQRRRPKSFMTIKGAGENNLDVPELLIPLGIITGVCGVSGSGKSTLIIDTIGRVLAPRRHTTSVSREPITPGKHDRITGRPESTFILDQRSQGITSPGGFLGVINRLEKEYEEASGGMSRRGFRQRCPECRGRGAATMDMGFLPSVSVLCEACAGTGVPPELRETRVEGFLFHEMLSLTLEEILEIWAGHAEIQRVLTAAREAGLGYLALNQPARALSGGETQRLKIVRELTRKTSRPSLFILDEPTVGQHLDDVSYLADTLRKLTGQGNSVIIVEHHPHILAGCDWLIELGPGGGANGGRVVFEGTPEALAQGNTPSAPWIKSVLEGGL